MNDDTDLPLPEGAEPGEMALNRTRHTVATIIANMGFTPNGGGSGVRLGKLITDLVATTNTLTPEEGNAFMSQVCLSLADIAIKHGLELASGICHGFMQQLEQRDACGASCAAAEHLAAVLKEMSAYDVAVVAMDHGDAGPSVKQRDGSDMPPAPTHEAPKSLN